MALFGDAGIVLGIIAVIAFAMMVMNPNERSGPLGGIAQLLNPKPVEANYGCSCGR